MSYRKEVSFLPSPPQTPLRPGHQKVPPPKEKPKSQVDEHDEHDEHIVSPEVLSSESLKDVYFDFDTTTLVPSSKERLQKNIEIVNALPNAIIQLQGHADARETNEYNLILGDKRANAIKRYLMADGRIDGDRIQTLSYGEEQPQCTESAEACWQLNRRVHFIVLNPDSTY